ncbi:hypothetical protein [Agromyces atrinae]|uniref:hypothetical protein n=1 Tax=Agromyces atrinae TaxID=592376 RepID=UPI00100F5567|nr:hypothetical protein [Agromyces atrinae]
MSVTSSSFAAEREWRLISPLMEGGSKPKFIHVPWAAGIKQFLNFDLLTPQHPVIRDQDPESIIVGGIDLGVPSFHARQGFRTVVGPSIDPDGMSEAISDLTPKEFSEYHQVERTESPYK